MNEASDIVYLVNYLYLRGPAPEPVAYAGNVDCQGGVDLVDVVYLVNYVFRGGPSPCTFCGDYRDPKDPWDAEAIAAFIGNDIAAPEGLLSRVQTDLERLRTQGSAEQTPLSSLHFVFPWTEGAVTLKVDSATWMAIGRAAYHAWDSMNTVSGMTHFSLDFSCGTTCSYHVYLRFENIVNCRVLAERYAALPGVLDAQYLPVLCIGFCPLNSIYPGVRGDTLTYAFEIRWYWRASIGYQRFLFAAGLPDTAWMIGDWELGASENPDEHPDPPAWWPQAAENITWYRGW
jgi:hypothetical protein